MTDGKIECIDVSTTHPTNNPHHIFKLFELRFNSINPEPGIEVFLLEAKKVEKIKAVQEKLWDISSTNGSDDQQLNLNKNLTELLDRLTAKFGEDHINRFVPDQHYWPERSYKIAADINEQPSTEWHTPRPRPMQLLEKPELIEVTAPIPDYPPMNFRHKGILHKIIKADGPERIEQEWWLSDGEHRDYYYVEDEEGRRYWLFRLGHYDADKNYCWFLHGYFA
jgi:protein ImuB